MKKTFVLSTLLALALAAGFVFVSCDTPTDGGDPTSVVFTSYDAAYTAYKLTISKSGRVAYTPQAGDTYVLIITPAGETPVTSSGTVSTIPNAGVFVLVAASGGTVTVQTSGAGITSCSGSIPLDAGGSHPPTGGLTAGPIPQGNELAGTVWLGRRETPDTFSLMISANKITWQHDMRYPTELTKEGPAYSGGSLAGTRWSGNFGNLVNYENGNSFIMTLEFIDGTNAKPSWNSLDYITYTKAGDTINFVYTTVREGELAFGENSVFQFKDRNTHATGTCKVVGGNITLNGVWQNGDAGAGTTFVVPGTISSGTITLTRGDFWGVMIFNKISNGQKKFF
jgi:hypothetical protein